MAELKDKLSQMFLCSRNEMKQDQLMIVGVLSTDSAPLILRPSDVSVLSSAI